MNKKIIKLTEDDFYERFNPIKNHIDTNAAFDGCMFETYGEEFDYITELIADGGNASVWTIEDIEGKTYFVNGYHYVNRLGYIITEEAVPEDEEIEVCLDTETDTNTAKLTEEIVVIDPDTKGEIHLSVFKHEQSGGMFALDSSFIDQVLGDDDIDKVIIPDPFNKDCQLELTGI